MKTRSNDSDPHSSPTKYSRSVRGPLVPCPGCARHIFAAVEGACPFCATALPADLAHGAAPATTERLSRAEQWAFNAKDAPATFGRGRELSSSELGAAAGGVRLDSIGTTAPTFPADDGSTFSMYGAPGDPWLSDPGTSNPDPSSQLPDPPGPPLDDPGGSGAEYGAPIVPNDPFDTTAPGGTANDYGMGSEQAGDIRGSGYDAVGENAGAERASGATDLSGLSNDASGDIWGSGYDGGGGDDIHGLGQIDGQNVDGQNEGDGINDGDLYNPGEGTDGGDAAGDDGGGGYDGGGDAGGGDFE